MDKIKCEETYDIVLWIIWIDVHIYGLLTFSVRNNYPRGVMTPMF